MAHQFNIFLLLFGALQGALLSLWLLWNRQKKVSNLYLCLFLVVLGLQLTFKVIAKGWIMDYARISYLMSYKLPYLIGPVMFLFVRSQKEERLKARDLLHFIPFLVFTMLIFFEYAPGPTGYLQAMFQALSLGIYAYLSLRLGNQTVKQFILFVAAAELMIIVTLAVMYVYNGRFPDVRLVFIVLTVLMYWITYKVLSRSSMIFPKEGSIVPLQAQKNIKYAHSTLRADEADRIEKMLHSVMVKDKLYQDSALTIDVLARHLQTSRHHLSQVLNERLSKTYADYIGDLRLEEARYRLTDPSNYRFTIAAIAMDSGFNSISTFNEAFKKQFNTTPSKYRNHVLKEKSA